MNSKNNENIFLEKLLNKFSSLYKINKIEIKKYYKYRFRLICFKYIYIIKHIDLHVIDLNFDI